MWLGLYSVYRTQNRSIFGEINPLTTCNTLLPSIIVFYCQNCCEIIENKWSIYSLGKDHHAVRQYQSCSSLMWWVLYIYIYIYLYTHIYVLHVVKAPVFLVLYGKYSTRGGAEKVIHAAKCSMRLQDPLSPVVYFPVQHEQNRCFKWMLPAMENEVLCVLSLIVQDDSNVTWNMATWQQVYMWQNRFEVKNIQERRRYKCLNL